VKEWMCEFSLYPSHFSRDCLGEKTYIEYSDILHLSFSKVSEYRLFHFGSTFFAFGAFDFCSARYAAKFQPYVFICAVLVVIIAIIIVIKTKNLKPAIAFSNVQDNSNKLGSINYKTYRYAQEVA
jgi:hypothetical protein